MNENFFVKPDRKELRKNMRTGATIGTWFATGYLAAFLIDPSFLGIDLPAFIWFPLCSSIGAVLGLLSLVARIRRGGDIS